MKGFTSFRYWPQVAVVLLLAVGYGFYKYFAYYNTWSSDSYVSAHVVNIAPLVSGAITHIYVKENQKVVKGQKLLEIDALPYRSGLAQAKEKLHNAQLNAQSESLVLAQVQLNQAEYLLKHTTLVAPEDGYITNFNLRTGQYVSLGQELFALIESKHWWVETRYRETALRLIKPGDKARISIDMYPGVVFHGHVDSIGWGINRVQKGNVANSTLVYVEATEDWIRIAQRFPVRISIDDLSDAYPMRIGASATTVTYR